MDANDDAKSRVDAAKSHLRLISVGNSAVVSGNRRRPRRGISKYQGITATLDTLLAPDVVPVTDMAVATGMNAEARRLLRIGGRLRRLAETCLDPAAPALERLGRTVELSGRRRLIGAVPAVQQPDGML